MAESGLIFIKGVAETPNAHALADVLFVHGLTGDHNQSWTHADGGFWPAWLAAEFPQANVYCASYDSAVFGSIGKGTGANLTDLATTLMDLVVAKCGSKRPLIIVAHSLGGLIVKQMIRKSEGSSNRRHRSVADRIRLIEFIGTPHQGAQLANALNNILGVVTSGVLKGLPYASEGIVDLHTWFSSWASKGKVEVGAYYETQKYKGSMIVDQVTANPAVLGCDPIAVDADHVSITKLATQEAHLYLSVRSAIADSLDQITEARDVACEILSVELAEEYKALTSVATGDRRTLAEKLQASGRGYEVLRAEGMKERFSMTLQRHIAQPSSVARNVRLMSQVETRYNRLIKPAIVRGVPDAEIDSAIQSTVIDPVVESSVASAETATAGQVESILYYLAGNCHIAWDNA